MLKNLLAQMQKELLRYVHPKGELPKILGAKHGRLLIIGSSNGVWDDLRRYDRFHGQQDRMAVNDMMNYYPGQLQYGATLHTDKMPMWYFNQEFLRRKQKWPPMLVHSHQLNPYVKYVWPLMRDGGTSGLFAVLVGLLMGYEEIILAGMPCDGSPRFFDPPVKNHQQFGQTETHEEWKRAIDAVFYDRVKSLSGNTIKWLGAPDLPEVEEEIVETVIEIQEPEPIVPVFSTAKVTVITPTGDRPEALSLLRRWMGAQTRQPDQWLIIDDGKTPQGKIHEATIVRREPKADDPACTLGENLKAAFPLVKHDKVLIMEDDDWYAPKYIETMASLLDYHELTGIWGTKYYHVGVPGYRNMGREGHASLSQTAFRKSFIPNILNAIPGDCSVDLRIWWHNSNGSGHLIPGAMKRLHCGIKGLPGRAGAGVGHDKTHFTTDPDYQMLKEWCDDWKVYQHPFKVRDRLVIYTAIAGDRGDCLGNFTPIPGVDYVCFTDQAFESDIWDIRHFSWTHKEAVRTAKNPKILPHKYFPDHDLSIWVDGNITPLPGALEAVKGYLTEYDMALHRHPARSCLYREAEHLIVREKSQPELLEKVIWRYISEKVPHNYGLYEGGILYRRHHDPAVKAAMELWWKEIKAGTRRDQVSLAYVLWKTGLSIRVIEENLRETPYFNFQAHQDLKYEDMPGEEDACYLSD
jgi:hypothetical protein